MVERLLFPSNMVITSAILLLIYLKDEPFFVNNVVICVISVLGYGLTVYLLKRRAKDENKLYGTSALLTLIVFFFCSFFLVVSKEIMYCAISLLPVIIFIYLIRTRWKISAHSATVTGVWAVLSLIDLIFLPLVSLLPLVVWSKRKLKEHTPIQLIAGTMIGLVVPLTFYLLLLLAS